MLKGVCVVTRSYNVICDLIHHHKSAINATLV